MTEIGATETRTRFAASRRRLLTLAFLFVLVFVAVTLRDSRLSTDPDRWRIRGDFSSFSLAASRVMAQGGDPYDRAALDGKAYKYFPLNATLLLPFTVFPVVIAQSLWIALNLFLLIGAVRLHRELAGGRFPWWVWVLALLVPIRYMKDCLDLGQWNLPVYVLTIVGLWLSLARERPFAGGFTVALAAGLKYMPVAFLLYFLVKRQWRAAGGMAAGLVFWILLLPTIVLGPARHAELFWDFTHQGTTRVAGMVGEEKIVGHSLLIRVYSLLTPVQYDSSHIERDPVAVANLNPATAQTLALTVCGAFVLLAFALLWRSGSLPPPGPRLLAEIGMVFALLLMISPEVRKAQMLTLFTPSLALALVLTGRGGAPWLKRTAGVVLGGSFALVLFSSELGFGSHLADWLMAHGSLTLTQLALYFGCAAILVTGTAETESTASNANQPATA